MQALPISALPLEISPEDAIEAAYRQELDEVQHKLSQGISVLLECDKLLTTHLYRALRSRFRNAGNAKRLRLVTGHAQPDAANPDTAAMAAPSLMQRILRQLQDAVFSGAENEVIVLPHLDILTTTTRSGLNLETREAAALLYENPTALFLGFKDPSFELPKVIEGVFPLKVSLIGLPRDRLPALVTQREARKLGVDTFNPFLLYKYVSGLNAIRLRQILGHFANRLDFTPSNPRTREDILREIRQMTLVTDVELPRVDLESDIGGYAKVKERIRKDILQLLEVKDAATDAGEVRKLEELIPKGIIFHGPPGTGKTYFAKAIATAIDAALTVVSGPELKSKWVGESEENLRRVFAQARKSAPAIIVFDELDSFAAARGTFQGSGVEHSMVNQLLTEMDGFRQEELVFIIGTTNYLESLDAALLRPGRFELCIEIPFPNEDDRRAILEIYRDRFDLDIDAAALDYAVHRTSGLADALTNLRYSGDHLYALMRALKREELRRGGTKFHVEPPDIDAALQRTDRDKLKFEDEEERTIAAHEAGHAILAYVLPHCPSIETVTIATGDQETLGYVMQSVKKNKYITTEEELLDDICVLLGGREAERRVLGKVSVGAYSDLQRANEIARLMVEELGMSQTLGPRTVGSGGTMQGGATGTQRRATSEGTAREVDRAIQEILEHQQERAKTLLAEHEARLSELTARLREKKTLGLADLRELFGGQSFKLS